MYNYQQHQRDEKIVNECKSNFNQFLRNNQIRKIKNSKFTICHKKRVDAFMLSSIESPIPIDEYKHPRYEPRDFLSEVKPIRPFRLNYHTTQERLSDMMLKNSYLDGVPFRNTASHNFRDYKGDGELRSFRYRATNTADRLLDSLTRSRSNQVEVYDPKITKRAFRATKNHMLSTSKIQSISKEIMPELHVKTYYNSLKSVLVQNKPSLKKQQENQKQPSDKHEANEGDRDLKKSKAKDIKTSEQIDRKSVALEALMKCKLMKDQPANREHLTFLRA